MSRKIAISLVGVLLVGSSAPLFGGETGDTQILPGLVAGQLHQLAHASSIPESLQQLNAQLSKAPDPGPRIEMEERGLSSEMRTTLGKLAAQAVRSTAPDLVPKAAQQPWRHEYSSVADLEVVAVDLSKTEQERKLEVRLRLWVARDASTAGRLLWILRGGPFWRPPKAREGAADALTEGQRITGDGRYRTFGVAGYSVPFEEKDPRLVSDRFGLLVGNVLVEIAGNSFFRLPGKEGWFTTGIVEDELVWQILSQVRSGLEKLDGPPVR